MLNRRVAVAGAGRPLGMSCVHVALERGASVIAGVRKPDAVPALRDLEAEYGDRLQVVPFEAANPEACERFASAAASRLGAVDLLVDAAIASGGDGRIADAEFRRTWSGVDPAEVASLLRVNAVGPLLLARAFAPLLAKGEAPALLIASTWLGALSGKVQGGDYGSCASMAARNMVARTLAHDLAAQGIAVVLANPGNFKTEIEGPSFQHRVEVAAAGLLDLVATAGVGESPWRDWTGAERAW
jgi:NAD(P)-dependent dehydrogenase (short-subunit alcohol dehydrogenase family)